MKRFFKFEWLKKIKWPKLRLPKIKWPKPKPKPKPATPKPSPVPVAKDIKGLPKTIADSRLRASLRDNPIQSLLVIISILAIVGMSLGVKIPSTWKELFAPFRMLFETYLPPLWALIVH